MAANPEPARAVTREHQARAYISALQSHDPREVHFAAHARRVENHLPTGFGKRHMMFDLRWGPQYRLIRSLTDLQVISVDSGVRATYALTAGLGPLALQVQVTETFSFTADDHIERIDASITR